jgi:hypothetical protein
MTLVATTAEDQARPRLSEAPGLERMPRARRLRHGCRYVALRNTTRLTQDTQDWLYRVLVVVSTRAFGADMTPYWRGRQEEGYFDKLRQFTLLVNADEEIIGWTGHHVQDFAGAHCLYLDSTGVLPEYQRLGLIDAVQTRTIFKELFAVPFRTVYLVVRTENPIIYRVLQTAVGPDRMYPPIDKPVPERIQAIAREVARWLNQEHLFDPQYLRLAGAYGNLEALYGELPTCSDPRLNEFFAEHLTAVDAFIVLAEGIALQAVVHTVRQLVRRTLGKLASALRMSGRGRRS